MRKGKSICKLLGVKQEELAMLLNISKGQLAMFETGKRDMPLAAKEQLAQMLHYMQDDGLKSGSASLLKSQAVHQKKVLEKLLKDNQYNQLKLERKRVVAEKKYHSNVAAIELIRYLEKEVSKKEAHTTALIKVIEARATAELEKKGWAVLIRYKIEKEVLQAEEKILLKVLSV